MGIFSLFGKKAERQAKPGERNGARSKRPANSKAASQKNAERLSPPKRDAQIALATALKIDAIESEMSSEFGKVIPLSRQADARTAPYQHKRPVVSEAPATAHPASSPEALMGALDTPTDFLLDVEPNSSPVTSVSEPTAVIEEAAILYANGQTETVQQLLQAAIEADNLGDVTVNAWMMLLDLYRLTGKQQEFDKLAIEYVNRFETSPPAWFEKQPTLARAAQASESRTMPTVPFSGKLDAGSVKYIQRLHNLAANYRTVRLEFPRVSGVDANGCGLLLNALKKLEKSEHEIVLVGALELADKVRAIIKTGRRDDTESGWLLLLELLRLLNREQEFEETSMDYCITFEVSPPAFVAPQSKVTTAVASSNVNAEGFLMPPIIEGRIDTLIVAIAAYSDEYEPAIIDCSQLERVDFSAAGRLTSGLAPFCASGKVLEFHHTNHLVAELFRAIGLKDIARVVPRKN